MIHPRSAEYRPADRDVNRSSVSIIPGHLCGRRHAGPDATARSHIVSSSHDGRDPISLLPAAGTGPSAYRPNSRPRQQRALEQPALVFRFPDQRRYRTAVIRSLLELLFSSCAGPQCLPSQHATPPHPSQEAFVPKARRSLPDLRTSACPKNLSNLRLLVCIRSHLVYEMRELISASPVAHTACDLVRSHI